MSASATRRWSRAIVGLLADAYLFLLLSLVVWVLLPVVGLGWSPVLVVSGSMSPAIGTGDVVLLAEPRSEQPVAPGTVLTYRAGDEERPRLVTHRVRRVDAAGAYVTRGDANRTDDAHPVPRDRVEGHGRLLVPLLGRPAHWARTGQWFPLLLFTGLTISAVVVSVRTSPSAAPTGVAVRRAAARGATAVPPASPRPRTRGLDAAPPTVRIDREALFGDVAASSLVDPCLWPPETTPSQVTVEPSLWARVEVAVVHNAVTATEDARPGERAARLSRPSRRLPSGRLRSRPPGRVATLVALVAIIGGGGQLPVAEATLSAVTGSVGNSFTTAVIEPGGDPLPPTLVLPPSGGRDTITAGQQPETFTFDLPVRAATPLSGNARAVVRVQPSTSGNPPRTIEVILRGSDGIELAAAASEQRLTGGWTEVTLTLEPALDVTLLAGSTLTVEVTLQRLELDLGGGSRLLLPVVVR